MWVVVFVVVNKKRDARRSVGPSLISVGLFVNCAWWRCARPIQPRLTISQRADWPKIEKTAFRLIQGVYMIGCVCVCQVIREAYHKARQRINYEDLPRPTPTKLRIGGIHKKNMKNKYVQRVLYHVYTIYAWGSAFIKRFGYEWSDECWSRVIVIKILRCLVVCFCV